MVQIGGLFKLLRNENFAEHLIALGIPESSAREVDQIRPVVEITVQGRQVTFAIISGEMNSSAKLTFDEEVDETLAEIIDVKSTATRQGNQIKIFSVGPKGETGLRTYEFFDTEMIMTLSSEMPDIPVAKRYYRRL